MPQVTYRTASSIYSVGIYFNKCLKGFSLINFLHFADDVHDEKPLLDMHTILVATTGSVIGIFLIVMALICKYCFIGAYRKKYSILAGMYYIIYTTLIQILYVIIL